MFHGCFKDVSWIFSGSCKGVSISRRWLIIAATRADGVLVKGSVNTSLLNAVCVNNKKHVYKCIVHAFTVHSFIKYFYNLVLLMRAKSANYEWDNGEY